MYLSIGFRLFIMGPQITLNTTFFGQDLNAEIAQIQSDFFIIYRLLVTLFLRVSALIAKELSLPNTP